MTVNSSADCDLISSCLNLGPLGTQLPVRLRIPHGLKPGSILYITARCENRLCIRLSDDANQLVQHLQLRVTKNEITISDQCLGLKEEDEVLKSRFSFTCVCEAEGYRIFINGRRSTFFKQNYNDKLTLMEISNCQVYKVMYTSVVFENKVEEITSGNKNNENTGTDNGNGGYVLPPAQ